MYTIYALCRMVDSAVDDPLPGTNPLEALAIWRKEVSAAYQGHPRLPVTISLAAHLQEFFFHKLILRWAINANAGIFSALYFYLL